MLSSSDQKRIFGLDFARAIAILCVVFHHLFLFSKPPAWLFPFGYLGNLGVEVFFVLSGYLLGHTLLKAFRNHRFSTGKEVFTIFFNRWLRIMPAYYFFFVVTAVVFPPFYGQIPSNLKYLFFLQNFAWEMPNLYFQSWTLAILEFFHVFFILCLFFLYKLTNRSVLSFLISLSLFALIPLLLRVIYIPLLGAVDFEAIIRKIVIYRLDAPVAGVLMAVVHREFPKVWAWLLTHSWIVLSLFAAITAYHMTGYPLLYTNHWAEVLFYPIVCLSFSLILPFLSNWKAADSLWGRGISFLSKLSYSIYVSHVVAMALALYLLFNVAPGTIRNYAVLGPVFLAAVLLLAYLSLLLVESPFMKLRDKWQASLKQPATASPASFEDKSPSAAT